ncbi:MAG TPA: hypothetical protein VFV67_34035 [Actinophytocola sp.]|uniref:hypothetical protein n=1 Tax=Actinophytocola sp. TaxID=1872138 RepID=UPI002DBF11E0|nr:hypothetical protein [Actinophytocola sp.]HEU5475688.1 hypothetical protein [Actinophytocola sp.]
MQRGRRVIVALAMCLAALSQVVAGFAALPTLWQLIWMSVAGGFALLVGLTTQDHQKNLKKGCKLQS